MKLQLVQGAAEVILAGQAETVYRSAAVLTHVDLVDIGIQQIVLVVVPLQDDSHRRFADLAPQAAPVVEKIILDQLLSQRAAALGHLAAAHVDDERPQQGTRVDPVM